MDAVQYVRDLIAAARRQDGFCLGVLVPGRVWQRLLLRYRADSPVDAILPIDPLGLRFDGTPVGPILDG
jgi:hypothetical protein